MVEIIWQDPPTRGGGTGINYDPVIDELKKNPGRWGLINTEWKTSAAPAAFRQQGCETTTRRNKGKKTWSVFARYPLPAAKQQSAAQQEVKKAIQNGTALVPPPSKPATTPGDDLGLKRFREERAARGVPPEGRR